MRSDELTEWIAQFSSKEEIRKNLWQLTPQLKAELLEEALKIPNIAHSYRQISSDPAMKGIAETSALEKFCDYPQINNVVQLTLPGWNLGQAPSANIIDTSSLFRVCSDAMKKDRQVLHKRTKLFSQNDTEILFSGEELNVFDWDVLHMMICMSNCKFNSYTVITPKELIERLGLVAGGTNYNRLKESFDRLSLTTLDVRQYEKKNGKADSTDAWHQNQLTTHLFSFHWDRGETISYTLDRNLSYLFGNSQYGLVDWEKRKQIKAKNDLAKKLQCFVSSQRKNNFIYRKIENLRQMCGLSSSNQTLFLVVLKKALTELIRVGCIKAFWISKPKRGEAEKRWMAIWVTLGPTEDTDEAHRIPDVKGEFFDEDTIHEKKLAKQEKLNKKKGENLEITKELTLPLEDV